MAYARVEWFHHEVDGCCVHCIHMVQRVHLGSAIMSIHFFLKVLQRRKHNSQRPLYRQGKRSPSQGGPFGQGWQQCSYVLRFRHMYSTTLFLNLYGMELWGGQYICEIPVCEHHTLWEPSGTRTVWKLKY